MIFISGVIMSGLPVGSVQFVCVCVCVYVLPVGSVCPEAGRLVTQPSEVHRVTVKSYLL